MGKVVSNSQNVFVGGRQILDAVLVANEAIDSRKRSAGAGLVCKLNIEKAYDHVNWRFLLSILEKMGFGPKWRNWILFRISTVRMTVLVNGNPTEFFSTFRGLRQGDPLLPYLFVLMMEAFNSLISRVEEKGFIRGFKVFNHALLGKWLWRFPLERESFWRKVIVAKFGDEEGGWTTREVRESYGTGLWKDIRKDWEEFFLRTSNRIGNGRRTRFWWDIWVGDSKLKDLFPLLFRIATHKSVVMADLWGRQGGGDGGWEVHFRRSFQDWELEEMTRFLDYISTVKVQEGEDSLVWKIERRGKFNVKSYYRSLKDENSPLFPTKEVWGSYAPLRTPFFAWEAVWGKISTIDMLMRRGWSMVNRCSLC
uniref:Reverse transcriptase domain-containing protein n=1 Tax=Vitis vinifera TaxID=29760 RepID=A5B4M7_VITVI|nr:hypothetical protein VITISV_022938 [Vitis vinifera]